MINIPIFSMLITVLICTDKVLLEEPFVVVCNDTITHLYHVINDKVSYVSASRGISIIFDGKLILNSFNDQRTMKDIGMHNGSEELFDIQIIQKPDVAALLEMASEISNIENITWFENAMQCLNLINDSSAIQCQDLAGHGLEYDVNGNLFEIDLSHLDLMGTIHLDSLPQTVRSLDLSFNDLRFLDLSGLKGKSVERLNLENNKRCHIEIESFLHEMGGSLTLKELQVSSYQIYPWITNLKEKELRIKNLLNHCDFPLHLIVDRQHLVQKQHRMELDLYSKMLRFVAGVTNKERIPWYLPCHDGMIIPAGKRKEFEVDYQGRRACLFGLSQHKFNLSGLGLEGEIHLGFLPRNVRALDLSNNNLSSIVFGDVGTRDGYTLRALNLQNNDNLYIDLAEVERARLRESFFSCLHRLNYLSISSNQLRADEMLNGVQMTKAEYVQRWLRGTAIQTVVIDEQSVVK